MLPEGGARGARAHRGHAAHRGPDRYRLEIATETAPVARTAIKLLHGVYGLKTELTVRRSVLHKTNNYLITVPQQPKLAAGSQRAGHPGRVQASRSASTRRLVKQGLLRDRRTCAGRSSAEGSSPIRTATSTSSSRPRPSSSPRTSSRSWRRFEIEARVAKRRGTVRGLPQGCGADRHVPRAGRRAPRAPAHRGRAHHQVDAQRREPPGQRRDRQPAEDRRGGAGADRGDPARSRECAGTREPAARAARARRAAAGAIPRCRCASSASWPTRH